MCNLYSLRKGPAAILDLAQALENHAGNLEGGSFYPDYRPRSYATMRMVLSTSLPAHCERR